MQKILEARVCQHKNRICSLTELPNFVTSAVSASKLS